MNNVEVIEPTKQRINKLKRVCAYVRVSTKDSHQDSSYDIQLETYTNMILENPRWTFRGVFADEGKSGTNTKYRDEFNQMIQIAKTRSIDMIITKSISRFARNTVDCLSVIKELKELDVEVFFEKENISSFDPKIEFVMTVMSGMAQEESRSISENVIWRQRNNFKNGVVPMVTSTFLGYKRDNKSNIIIAEKEAKIVRMIYDMYSNGSSINKIVEYLNRKGYTTKANNKPYYHGAVLNILNNERYTGNAILQKTKRAYVGDRNGIKNQTTLPKYYVENSHPAIISMDQYQEVHKIKNSRILKYNKTLDKTILSQRVKNKSIYSEFVQCSNCGRYFHSKINHPGKVYEKHILMCPSNKQKKTCSADILYTGTINEIIISHINYLVENKKDFLETLRSHLETSTEVINRKKRILEINETLQAIKNNDLSIYKKQIIDLNIELTALENSLLTTFNIDSIINNFDTILKRNTNTNDTVNDFPFKDIFQKIIVHRRDYVQLIINPFNIGSIKTTFQYNKTGTDYLIRKTPHKAMSELVITY